MTFTGEGFTGTLNKTWQQIRDAMPSKICVIIAENGDNAVCRIINSVVDNPTPMEGDERYQVGTDGDYFTTDSKDGYPSIGGGL